MAGQARRTIREVGSVGLQAGSSLAVSEDLVPDWLLAAIAGLREPSSLAATEGLGLDRCLAATGAPVPGRCPVAMAGLEPWRNREASPGLASSLEVSWAPR